MKKMTIRSRIGLTGASILALAVIAPAAAQAQAAAAEEDTGIQDIIVTAQKREQNMQDVPAAITALGGAALESNGVRNVADLSGMVPNLTSVRVAGGSSLPSITMRGARASASMPGSEKQIGMYVDGVYIGANTGSVFDLGSIDRIEVLRGPQGTLFGQSATGGAISIFTPDPTGELHVKQAVTVGNYRQFRSTTHVDFPAVGPFALALTYDHNERRGDVRNTGAGTKWNFGSVPNSGYGILTSPEWLGSSNVESIQAALKFEPSDSFKATYKFYWVDTNATPDATGNTGVSPLVLGGTIDFFNAFYAAGITPTQKTEIVNQLSAYPTYRERPDALNNWYTAPSHFRNEAHIVTAMWKPMDKVSLKNTFGYMKNSYKAPMNQLEGIGGIYVSPDSATTPAANPATVPGALPFGILTNGTIGKNREYYNELQLNYTGEFLTLTAGYLHYDIHYQHGGVLNTPVTYNFTKFPNFVLPATLDSPAFNENKSDAVYGQAEIHINPQLDFVGGVRYTWDKKKSVAPARGVVPGLVTYYRDARATYSLGLNFKATDDILLYAKYATAYVAGGAYFGVPWNPETAKSVEAGVKADLLDRKLRINAAAFSVDYKDLQITASGLASGNPAYAALPQVMLNAGDGRARGFELEVTAAPTRGVMFGGSLGYTDFKYSRTTVGAGSTDPTKVRPLFRPEWTANVNAQYDTQPLVGDAYLTFRADANYTGAYETVAVDSFGLAGVGHVKGTWIVNGRVALTKLAFAGADGEIALWGRNLTNNRNIVYSFTANYANNATFQRARTFGVDLKVSF